MRNREVSHTGTAIGLMMIFSLVLTKILNEVTFVILQMTDTTSLVSDPYFILMLQMLFSVLVLTLPFLLVRPLAGDSIVEIFPDKKVPKKTFAELIMIGCGILPLANLANEAFGLFFTGIGMAPVGSEFEIPDGFSGAVFMLLAGAVFPAVLEEFAIRGIVLGTAKKHLGNTAAVFISATVFSLMHGNLVQIPFAFIVGLYSGYITICTGSLLPAMVLHFINNAIAYLLDIIYPNLGPVAGTVISYAYFIIMLAIGLVGFILYTRENDAFRLEKSEKDERSFAAFKAPGMIIYFALEFLKVVLTQLGVNLF